MRIRAAVCEIEHELGKCQEPAAVKEFDKAITVIKIGAKGMKRELKLFGYIRLGKTAKARVQ